MQSIQNLASMLPEGKPQQLDARRFRANIYVDAPIPYAEDHWKLIQIGSSVYHVSCRTARCKLPNNNPETGILDLNEPLTTYVAAVCQSDDSAHLLMLWIVRLRRHRQIDEGAHPHPCLGMQMVPQSSQTTRIRVGDAIKILQTGQHHYIKQGTADMAA